MAPSYIIPKPNPTLLKEGAAVARIVPAIFSQQDEIHALSLEPGIVTLTVVRILAVIVPEVAVQVPDTETAFSNETAAVCRILPRSLQPGRRHGATDESGIIADAVVGPLALVVPPERWEIRSATAARRHQHQHERPEPRRGTPPPSSATGAPREPAHVAPRGTQTSLTVAT